MVYFCGFYLCKLILELRMGYNYGEFIEKYVILLFDMKGNNYIIFYS